MSCMESFVSNLCIRSFYSTRKASENVLKKRITDVKDLQTFPASMFSRDCTSEFPFQLDPSLDLQHQPHLVPAVKKHY